MKTYRSSLFSSIFTAAVLIQGGDAVSTFQPICTLPPNGTHFVRNPTARSSLSILWSTAVITVLCTWSVLHLNVPSIHSTRSKWRIFWNKCLDSRIKLKWMLFTILVPEYLMGKALSDSSAVKHFPGGARHPTQTYLANMGYFVLEWDDHATWTRVQQEVNHVLATGRLPSWQRVNIERLKTKFWALDAWQWKVLSEANIAHLPNTPEWQLDKLDHGGILIKLLALSQVVYLIVELIARAANKHPSTQLEVSALAFAGCSFVTYLRYLSHPQGIEALHYVQAGSPANPPTEALIKRLGEVGPLCLWTGLRGQSRFDPAAGPEPIPNDATHMGSNLPRERIGRNGFRWVVTPFWEKDNPRNKEVEDIFGGIFTGGIIFGFIHLIGMGSHFPTFDEEIAWTGCSLVIVCISFSVPGLNGCLPLVGNHSKRRRIVTTVIWGIFFLLYTLSRLFLIVESIWTLFFQPPNAYANTWASEFPH